MWSKGDTAELLARSDKLTLSEIPAEIITGMASSAAVPEEDEPCKDLTPSAHDPFRSFEVVGFTPEEWDKKTSPLYDYAKQGEILYAA